MGAGVSRNEREAREAGSREGETQARREGRGGWETREL